MTTAQKLSEGTDEVLPGFDFSYAFDTIGNRMSTTINEHTVNYSANAINQYTQRDHPGAVDVRGYAPEQVGVIVNGERTQRTDGDFYAEATADNSTASVEFDITVKAVDPGPPELLAEESRTALLPQNPESFTYDLDGNLTQDGLWTYEWDAENRLTAMESRTDLPASVVRKRLEFTYDSQSRRIQKIVKAYDSGTASWITAEQICFLYDGWNLLAEYDATNSDALLRSHTWGLDLSGTPQGAGGVGGLLWSTQATNTYAPSFDANGNIIAWVDLSDGTLAGTAEYGAFGELLVQSGVSAELPFGFSTKYEDVETGLLYYGFRYYDAQTGRWPSRDPIEERGGLNLYGMVGNDAVNQWDYLGLYKEAICCTKEQEDALKAAEGRAWGASMRAEGLVKGEYTEDAILLKYADRINRLGFLLAFRGWRSGTLYTLSHTNAGFHSNNYKVKCTQKSDPGVDAYTRPRLDNTIRFNDEFFTRSASSQADTFLHEASHIFAGTKDHGSGGAAPYKLVGEDAHWIGNLAKYTSPRTLLDRTISNMITQTGR